MDQAMPDKGNADPSRGGVLYLSDKELWDYLRAVCAYWTAREISWLARCTPAYRERHLIGVAEKRSPLAAKRLRDAVEKELSREELR